ASDVQTTPTTHPMGPPTRPRKRKAPTLCADAWEPYKARIVELHVTLGLSLPEVKKKIEDEFGFTAELRQYRTRVSQWGKDKNVKPQEMRAIVRKRQQRRLVEVNKGELLFKVRGKQVEPQKIDRWMKSHEVPESLLYAPTTPSAVGCRTISERGSPAPSPTYSPATSALSPRGIYFTAQSPQAPSPTISVSSVVQLQSSTFVGQSPAPIYRSLPNFAFGAHYTPSALETQLGIETASLPYRYRQTEEECLRDELSRTETSLGPRHSKTLGLLSELGWVLVDQGRYKSAEEVARHLVDGCRTLSGDDNVETLQALSLLGQVLCHQGLYVKAEKLHRRALEGKEKVLGPEHSETLISVDNLGVALGSQGRYQEAEAMHRRALEGNEKVLGPEHSGTLISVDNLGLALRSQGRFQEAEAMHRRALEGKEKVLGPEHSGTLSSVDNLGVALGSQGRYQEAEAMHRRALEGKEKVLGPEHPETLISVDDLGFALGSQGRYQEAEAMHRRALEGKEKVLGLEHPSTLISIYNVALLYHRRQHY
ncbi:TPR-like protein, partial [Lojkania enalia]